MAMKESEGRNESRTREISDGFWKANRNSLSAGKAKPAKAGGKNQSMMMQNHLITSTMSCGLRRRIAAGL